MPRNPIAKAVTRIRPQVVPDKREKLREQAEKNVLRVRGSYDAPGFEACVESEINELLRQETP